MADYGTFLQHTGDTLGAADFSDYVRRALGDKAGDYNHISLEDHYRRAIDAALDGTGIGFQGERFYGPDAVDATFNIGETIAGALHDVDFWEIASHHSRHEERRRDEALRGMAEALKADVHFDHVDFGWNSDRRREELTMVAAGNKYEPEMTYLVSAYWGYQPPRPDMTVPAKSDPDCLAFEVEALWEEEGSGEQVQRAALCASLAEVLALMRGLRAEYAAREGDPLGVPEQPGHANLTPVPEPAPTDVDAPMVAVADVGRALAAAMRDDRINLADAVDAARRTNNSAAAGQRDGLIAYHYVLTIEWDSVQGHRESRTWFDRYYVAPGTSREAVFTDVLKDSKDIAFEDSHSDPGVEDAVVRFFSLERDALI
ncbi:hypothetical protein [Actinomadura violacea]|uniref:Uncharacterized protein n=1 Tax=Actinomadura violacea TaxID=2819934 RepID=A0ABS3S029_9ACTN|nr:hypothetical protein [Actinomadura violacea]MBO2461620.1 hypothetical protein [Actinomadura violacea]